MNLFKKLFGEKCQNSPSTEDVSKASRIKYVAPAVSERKSLSRWVLGESLGFVMITDHNRCIVCEELAEEDPDVHTYRCSKCYNNFFP